MNFYNVTGWVNLSASWVAAYSFINSNCLLINMTGSRVSVQCPRLFLMMSDAKYVPGYIIIGLFIGDQTGILFIGDKKY